MGSGSSLGEFEQLVLLAILRLDDEAYGVSIQRELLEHAGRKVVPGALYTTLDRLSTKGLLVSREGEPTAVRGGRAKRYYTVTPEGRTLLVEAQRGFQRMLAGLKLLEEQHG